MIWSTPSDRLCEHLGKVQKTRQLSNIGRVDTVDITGLVGREWRIPNAAKQRGEGIKLITIHAVTKINSTDLLTPSM